MRLELGGEKWGSVYILKGEYVVLAGELDVMCERMDLLFSERRKTSEGRQIRNLLLNMSRVHV